MEKSAWCYTTRKVSKYELIWCITDFSSYHKVGEQIDSSEFPVGSKDELKFKLNLLPNGNSEANKNKISLYLYPFKLGLNVHCQFSVLTDEDEEVNFLEFSQILNNSRGYLEFIKRGNGSNVGNVSNGNVGNVGHATHATHATHAAESNTLERLLCKNDELKIRCRVAVYTDYVNTTYPVALNPSKYNINQLSVDFGKLLNEPKLTDVELLVGQKKFRAHKAVLAARSSVFAAMFEHDMVEERSNQVIISDITEDVFEKMLQFMYTNDKIDSFDGVAELLAAADKYDLGGLKILCEEILARELDLENAVDTLILADRHNVVNLESDALHFIRRHNNKIFRSSLWVDQTYIIPSYLLAKIYDYAISPSQLANQSSSPAESSPQTQSLQSTQINQSSPSMQSSHS